MPVFEYKCKSCGTKYEVLHRSTEKKDDVLCPSCGSRESEKMFSTFNSSLGSSNPSVDAPSCPMSSCCGETCELN